MSIKITCPSCDDVFTVADNMRGKKVACRECDKTIVVPAGKPTKVAGGEDEDDQDKDKVRKGKPTKLAAAGRFRDDDLDEVDEIDEVEEVEDEDKVRKGKPAKVAAAGRFRDAEDDDADDEDEDGDEEEDSKKKKKSMMPLILIGGGLALAAAAAVILIVVMGGRNSDASPKENQVAQNPPNQNQNPQGGNPQGGNPQGGNPQGDPKQDDKRDPEVKKDPKVEEPEPQPVVISSLSGEKVYQRLLKSTVWIVADQGGGPSKGPPTGGPPQGGPPKGGPPQGGGNDLAGSSWSGTETLKGYGTLQFQFAGGGQVTMIDKDGRTPGTYTQNGVRVVLNFGASISYSGTINGQTMSGQATNTRDSWTWSVTKQGGGGGGLQPPGGGFPGGKGPGGFPMPPGGGFPGGFPGGGKGPGGFPGGFPMPPGGGKGGFPGGGGASEDNNKSMQFPQPPGGFPQPGQQIGGFPPGIQPPGGFPGGKGPGGFPGGFPGGGMMGGKGPGGFPGGGPFPGGKGPGGFPGGGVIGGGPGGFPPPSMKGPDIVTGSGSLIDRKHRLILTNVHVVGRANNVIIHFPTHKDNKLIVNKDAYMAMPGIKGTVVMKQEKADIALIQLEKLPNNVAVLPMSMKGARPAQEVHSMGNPGASKALWRYSPGKVRGEPYADKWKVLDDLENRVVNYDAVKLETDSAINSGDSGGPLVDSRCVLVGVTHASNITAQNMSIFIDVSECRTLITNFYKSKGETWVPEPEPRGEEEIARIPELIKKLSHKDFAVRLNAIQALGNLGAEATLAFEPLFKAMKDTNSVVKNAVGDALEKVPPHKNDLPMLCQTFQNAQEPMDVRLQAVKCVSKLGPNAKSALPMLTQQIKEGDQNLRLTAFTAMIAIGPEEKDVPILVESLKSADPEFRRLAGEALAKMGPQAKPAIPALLANLKGKDKALRLVAMRALQAIGPDAKEAVPLLTEVMQESDTELAMTAAVALGKIGGDTKATVGFLRKTLRNSSGALKKQAAQGLGEQGAWLRGNPSEAKFVIKELLTTLNDDEARLDAKVALVKIGKITADSIAQTLMGQTKGVIPNDAARLAGIEALGELGHQSPTVGNALTYIYRFDTVDENKKAAARVWEKLTGKKVKTSGG
jgi:HEAT repeat protein